ISKINRLREELNSHYTRLQFQSRPSGSPDFESIALKEQELARALRDVSVMDPEYTSLQQVSIATLKPVQAALPKRTTLIEYFTSNDEIVVFIIRPDGAKVVRRVCPASLASSLQEQLRFQLETFLLGGNYVSVHAHQILESTRHHLHELYRNLTG